MWCECDVMQSDLIHLDLCVHPSPTKGVSISPDPIWIKDQPIIVNQIPQNTYITYIANTNTD